MAAISGGVPARTIRRFVSEFQLHKVPVPRTCPGRLSVVGPPIALADCLSGDARAGVILVAMRMIAALLLAVGCAAAAAPQYSGELIFPLEKWHNHSSSIVELPNGDLLVCWFHGSGEREADDTLIQAARWNRATGKWTAPFTLADTPGFPETNPVLFLDSRQRLFFLWPLIIAHKRETALMKYRISTRSEERRVGKECRSRGSPHH